MAAPSPPTIRWARSGTPVPYPAALQIMTREVDAILAGTAQELLWFLEHPPLLTRGTRSRADHLLSATRFPVYETDRGGELTYHGPGQRIVYTLLDVRRHAHGDVRAFVRLIEDCVIAALDSLGVVAHGDPQRPGVWVARAERDGGEAKIAAVGLKVRRGISLHGLSLNIAPDLTHFDSIVPCGLEGSAVTSLAALGAESRPEAVDKALHESFRARLGPLGPAPDPFAGHP